MSAFSVAKSITHTVVGHSASFATARVIVANAPTNGGLYERAAVFIGAIGVGAFVGQRTSEYVDEVFDEIRAAVTDQPQKVTTLK